MSVMFGVSFTSTGVRATSFTHSVIICAYSGTWPHGRAHAALAHAVGAAEVQLEAVAPASSARFTISCQVSRFDSVISER
jgi:hypothetical protein